MSKHRENLRCPKCLKVFETPHGLKAHQRRKKHTVDAIHHPDERRARAALQNEHARRVALAAAAQALPKEHR